jgi:hypothetical protein
MSSPAGWNQTSFLEKMVLGEHHFFQKDRKEYHAAAGESGFHLVKRPV